MMMNYYFARAFIVTPLSVIFSRMYLKKAIVSESSQWTGFHSVFHHLCLTIWAFLWRCNSSLVQINSTLSLSCLEYVQHGPQLVRDIKSCLSYSWVWHQGLVDHRSQLSVAVRKINRLRTRFCIVTSTKCYNGSFVVQMCVLSVFTDFPQVHTVTRFVASEPDELNLEEADVVSVYQKSPDG